MLKPSKCHWARQRVEFLGFVVSNGGIEPDSKKVDKLRRFPNAKD